MNDQPLHRLSPSQLTTWLICPKKWENERILGWPSRIGATAPVGSALNDAILAFLGERMSVGAELSAEEMADKGAQSFAKNWAESDLFLPGKDPQEARIEAEEKVRKAILCWHHDLRHLVTEPLGLEERWSIQDGDIELLCYLDCRDSTRILDWKWKGRTPPEQSVHFDHQLTTYWWAIAASELPPPETVALACIIGNKTPKSVVLESTRTWQDVEALRSRYHQMAESIEVGSFPPANPEYSNFCGPTSCCHWDRCPYGRAAYSVFSKPSEVQCEF